MKVVRCKNIYKNESGRAVECGRILAVLTDLQIDILAIDEEKPVFRCPKCHSDDRWIEISKDKQTKNLKIKVLENHPEFNKEDDIQYEEIETVTQVG